MTHLIHVVFKTRSGLAIAPDVARATALLQGIVRSAGGRLVLFGVAGDHLHLVLDVSQGRGFRDLRGALVRVLEARCGPMTAPHVSPVEDADHLASLIGYGPRQPWKHHLPDDPLLYAGSHLPDLLGSRLLPGFDRTRLQRELPHVDVPATLAAAIGLPDVPSPADDATVLRLGAQALWDAARFSLMVDVRGHTPASDALPRVFVALGAGAGMSRRALREVGELTESSYHRAKRATASAELLAVVRRRLGAVDLAARHPMAERKVPERTPPPVLRPRGRPRAP